MRRARDDRAGRHVARDDRAGPDDRTGPDPDAAEDDRAGAQRGAALDDRLQQLPVLLRLQGAVARRRARVLVVDEHDAVPDEDLVLDRDPLADEGVALDLAAGADPRSPLDLDERPDPGRVADLAAVEIRERSDDDVRPEADVVEQPVGRVVRGLSRHG